MTRFSTRASWDLSEGAASQAARIARARRPDLVDLTETNPTRVGLATNRDLAALLGSGVGYEPEPRGHPRAREAVARYYAERGVKVEPEAIMLSASTSEAYAWLFKLLCDPGEEVVVPTPSYPLFSYLASLEGVVVRSYPLVRAEGFRVDTDALRSAIGPRTKAIVVVAPNNPTGTLLHEEDARALDELAQSHGLALVVDEVFGDYVDANAAAGFRRWFAGTTESLCFVMSGLSKVCCAPGLKLGWTTVTGAGATDALARLEVIADTYLSVATPVQLALPSILERCAAIQAELWARITLNRSTLEDTVRRAPSGSLRVVPSHGGWMSLLEVPRVVDEDAWVAELALEAGVLVQPGYFFDLTDGGTLALSLIVSPSNFERGVAALVAHIERALA